jgi:hypothetical protein
MSKCCVSQFLGFEMDLHRRIKLEEQKLLADIIVCPMLPTYV